MESKPALYEKKRKQIKNILQFLITSEVFILSSMFLVQYVLAGKIASMEAHLEPCYSDSTDVLPQVTPTLNSRQTTSKEAGILAIQATQTANIKPLTSEQPSIIEDEVDYYDQENFEQSIKQLTLGSFAMTALTVDVSNLGKKSYHTLLTTDHAIDSSLQDEASIINPKDKNAGNIQPVEGKVVGCSAIVRENGTVIGQLVTVTIPDQTRYQTAYTGRLQGPCPHDGKLSTVEFPAIATNKSFKTTFSPPMKYMKSQYGQIFLSAQGLSGAGASGSPVLVESGERVCGVLNYNVLADPLTFNPRVGISELPPNTQKLINEYLANLQLQIR